MQNQNSVKLASAKWEIIPKCEIGKISADSKCKVFEKKKCNSKLTQMWSG